MRSLRLSRWWAAGLAVAALSPVAMPGAARAIILGGAAVGVNRIGGNPGSQEFPMIAGLTDYETPVASLSASLGFPNQPPSLRANARAVAGIDLARGAFYGTLSTFSRMETPGTSSRASANSAVRLEDTFQVLSDTLPTGTLVDVSFDLLLRFRGTAGAGGHGACCSILTTYEFWVEGNMSPYDSSYAALHRTGSFGTLAGGIGDDPIELSFGRYSAPAFVGGNFYLGVNFELNSLAVANAQYDPDVNRNVPGQSEAAGSASLFLSTEVTPAGGAAARAQAASAYLYSSAGGFALPGAEAFEPANLHSYWLAPVPVPEPATTTLVMLGLAALGARGRRARVLAPCWPACVSHRGERAFARGRPSRQR